MWSFKTAGSATISTDETLRTGGISVLDYDREAARYDITRGGNARADAAARAVESLLPPHARVIIDVACGTGIVTNRLRRPGRRVIGIDRSAGMAAFATGRLTGCVALGDATRLPIARASVDAVVMIWLLHLLDAPACEAALAEAARTLRPGGTLITTTHKDDADFTSGGDVAALLAPPRAAVAAAPADGLDRIVDLAGRDHLTLSARTTFPGLGQGRSPRRWRTSIADGRLSWTRALDHKALAKLQEQLAALPEQDAPRPDPVYSLIALRTRAE
jgi:SAM-dependent methyltransferase